MPIFARPTRIAAVTVGAMLAAFVTSGCHDDSTPAPTVVTTPAAPTTVVTTPGAATGGSTTTTMNGTTATTPDTKINTNAGPGASTGTDTALSDAVNMAIVHNKQMTGSRVEPVATAGVVTLNRQVQNQQQKALAEKTATQVPGVAGIKNKLIIVTTGGAKPKPTIVTKTKTVIVHDKAAPAPTTNTMGGADTTPAAPDASGTTPPPAAPDAGTSTP